MKIEIEISDDVVRAYKATLAPAPETAMERGTRVHQDFEVRAIVRAAVADAMLALAKEFDSRFFREPEVHMQKHIVECARRVAGKLKGAGGGAP